MKNRGKIHYKGQEHSFLAMGIRTKDKAVELELINSNSQGNTKTVLSLTIPERMAKTLAETILKKKKRAQ